jgi:N-acetylmuramoyl-L-alanine amidase
LVLHGTAGGGTIEWFQNPTSKVSAHYVVGQDGSVTQMVSEDDTAWHNGMFHFYPKTGGVMFLR